MMKCALDFVLLIFFFTTSSGSSQLSVGTALTGRGPSEVVENRMNSVWWGIEAEHLSPYISAGNSRFAKEHLVAARSHLVTDRM